ncbi:MAG: MFS transporter [Muribaculaceae bacterium]|nr:MFS transporter [Muribaculaceae bacterium]MDE6836093.1 MFS transporter [Muribaculaceae bacterium]
MRLIAKKYIIPFILISSLFFVWGFARAVLDVLNKHFQDFLSISISQSALVQGTTYLGYFLMALPAGIMITRWGYRAGVVTGLSLFAAGAFLFIPGEYFLSFPIFLTALFIIGCGLAILETAANPYATELGPPETASSRLNLAQSLNGLGCILGPVIVGGFLFARKGNSVALPYSIMGAAVAVAAVIFSRVKLPEIAHEGNEESNEEEESETSHSLAAQIKSLWSSGLFRAGVITLFFYEIAEIAINSLFINYVIDSGWMDKAGASALLSFGALTLFMFARIIGSAVMSRIRAVKVLFICGVGATVGALAVAFCSGIAAATGLFACYLFEAIMFPTIFAITIAGVKSNVKIASSFLMMTPIGGAVGTLLMGMIADTVNISTAFIVPAIAYCAVIIYARRYKDK